MDLIRRLAVVAIVVAACGGSVPTATGDEVWRTAVLTDARTGESYTIDSLRGRLVALEPMAVWCPNCESQQREVATALDALDDPGLVYVSLDIELDEQEAVLAAYADDRGFDWTFSVATPEVARSLAASFGDQVLSPPSTPLILIGPDGRVVSQGFGIKTADELLDLFRENLP